MAPARPSARPGHAGRSITAWLLGPVLALAGCGGGGGEPASPDASAPVDAVSAACLEATQHSDLPWIQANILTPKCTFSSCHNGNPANSALDLTEGKSLAALVGVTSHVFSQYKLVVPGDPANSYLLSELRGGPQMIDPNVGTMPQKNPLLCKERVDAIERWIMAGATAN